MPSLPFKLLFCQRFGCSPEDYEERTFRKCLYWHARFLAPVVRTLKPDFFLRDLEFIRYLGDAVDVRQAKVDVLDFKDMDRKHWRLLHTGLNIRVSHRKARRLAFQLLGKPDWPGDSAPSGTNRTNNHSAGFTLIELLVAIAIIAILAAMLLPVLSKLAF